jgi:serine/threonine protein kinase
MMSVLQAVSAMHERGIVHRNINPNCILKSSQGIKRYLLSEFYHAINVDTYSELNITLPMKWEENFHYLAPEYMFN